MVLRQTIKVGSQHHCVFLNRGDSLFVTVYWGGFP